MLCAAGHLEHSHVHDDDPDGHHHDMHDSTRWVKGAKQCTRRVSTVNSSKAVHAAGSAQSTGAKHGMPQAQHSQQQQRVHVAGSAQPTAAKQCMAQAQHSQQQHDRACRRLSTVNSSIH
jgi:hypothetical protein